MRIAVLSDIHGNLPALEAVLADAGHRPVDKIAVATFDWARAVQSGGPDDRL